MLVKVPRLIRAYYTDSLTSRCPRNGSRLAPWDTDLLPPNYYLSVAIHFLFQHRPKWSKDAAVGKTVVSSQMIDRVATNSAGNSMRCRSISSGLWLVFSMARLALAAKRVLEHPSCVVMAASGRRDKDGIAPALLAAEITVRTGLDPVDIYRELTREFGEPAYDRVEAPATPAQKERLSKLSPRQLRIAQLAEEKIERVLDRVRGQLRDRRHQGGHRQRLVRRTAIWHGGHLQDLC